MTKHQRAEKLAGMIEEVNLDQVRDRGGYPCQTDVIAGHVIVADVEDDRPTLEIYTPDQVRKWLKVIGQRLIEEPDGDLAEALNEARP